MTSLPHLDFREERLENGLQVLLYSDRRVPLVHVTLHYRVGASYEKKGHSGLAHLFEHMMFQGSERVAANQHGRYIDLAGGSWNATTSKDRTNYYQTLTSNYLELILWLESDRMRSLRVTRENFENQRLTVIEEKKQSYDNRPYGRAFLRFEELAYDNWAYAHPIIGSVRDLKRATLEEAQEFHRTHYCPSNAVLALAGDFEISSVRPMLERHFGSIPAGTNRSFPQLEQPPQTAPRSETVIDPLAPLAAVCQGFPMPALGEPDHYALALLAVVLSEGESSRLYQDLVYEHNWISSLAAGPNQYRGPQLFNISFQVQRGVDPRRVVEAVWRHLLQLARQPVTQKELEKAKNQFFFRAVSERATVSRIGEALAHCAVFFDDPDRINHEVERYLAVQPDHLQAAAARVFREENSTTIVVQPGAPNSSAGGLESFAT